MLKVLEQWVQDIVCGDPSQSTSVQLNIYIFICIYTRKYTHTYDIYIYIYIHANMIPYIFGFSHQNLGWRVSR